MQRVSDEDIERVANSDQAERPWALDLRDARTELATKDGALGIVADALDRIGSAKERGFGIDYATSVAYAALARIRGEGVGDATANQ